MYVISQMISSLLQLAIVLLLAFVLKAIFQKKQAALFRMDWS